ncbi:MAG: choice-of-anchor J domain-containing protein [Luteibaculaceae bacterium]
MNCKTFTKSRWATTRTWLFMWFALLSFAFAPGGKTFGQIALTENFNTAALPTGWSASGFATSDVIPCEGARSIRTNLWSLGATRTLSTPNLGLDNNQGPVEVSFTYKLVGFDAPFPPVANTPNWGTVRVQYATATAGPWIDAAGVINNTNHVQSGNCVLSPTFTFSPLAGNLFVRILGTWLAGDYWLYVDEFNITQGAAPLCFFPAGLATSGITSNSATLNWVAASNDVNGYEWRVMAQGVSVETGTPIASGSTAAGITTAQVPALASATNYQVFVRTNCGGDGFSSWSAGVNFTTLCEPTMVSLPFLENFNSTTALSIPNCWSRTVVSGTNNWNAGTTTNNTEITSNFDGNFMFKAFGSSVALLSTPELDFSNVSSNLVELRIQLHRRTNAHISDVIRVHLNDQPNLTGATLLQEFPSLTSATRAVNAFSNGVVSVAANGWYQQSVFIPISALTGGTKRIVFEGITDGGFSSWAIGFDNFELLQAPTCFAPSTLTASNITATGADLSWALPLIIPSNGYEYVVSTSNVAPTAAGTAVASNSATVTGLNSSTQYFVFVRSSCGNGDFSAWASIGTFTTACDVFSLPLSQNFDTDITTPNLPLCWSRIIATPGNVVSSTLGTPFSAPNQITLTNGANTTNFIGLVTPELAVSSTGFYKVSFRSRSLTAAPGAPLQIGTLTNPADPSTFVLAATVSPTSAAVAQFFEVGVPVVAGQPNYIVFRHGNGAASQTIYVDNVLIETGLVNDLAVLTVRGPFQAVQGANTPMLIGATIRNNGVNPVVGPIAVNISSAGDNPVTFTTFNWTPATPIGPFQTALLQLNLPGLVSNLGENTITFAVPADDDNSNNSASFVQVIDPTILNFVDNNAPFLVAGTPINSAREFITSFNVADSRIITYADFFLGNGTLAVGRPVFARIYDNDFNILAESAPFTAAVAGQLSQFVRFNFPAPVAVNNQNIRVALVTPTHTAAYSIMGVQLESPLTRGATFQVRTAANLDGLLVAPLQSFADLRYGLRLGLFDPAACFPPANLAVSGTPTESEGVITWTQNLAAPSAPTAYQIRFGLQGFDVNTGGTTISVAGDVLTATLTGLQASRTFDVYVRAICTEDPLSASIWERVTLRTACGGEEPLPFIETFELNSQTLGCATYPNGVGNMTFQNFGAFGQSGRSLRIVNWSGITAGSLRSIQIPITEPTVGRHKVAFDHAHRRFGTDVEQLRVEASNDDGATYSIVETLLGGVNGPLTTDATGTGEFLNPTGFWASKQFDLPEGTNRVRLTMVSAAGNNLFLDNIEVRCANDAEFEYASNTFCVNGSNPLPTILGDAGGVFSSTGGLVINAETGAIDLAASTPGTYTVTYALDNSNGCFADSQTFQVTIQEVATISADLVQEFCGGEATTVLGFPSVQDIAVNGTDLVWFTRDADNNPVAVANNAFILSGTYFVFSAPAGLCASDTLEIAVTITTAPFAGSNGSPSFCVSDTDEYDLNDFTSGGDAGGVWTDADGDVVTDTEFVPATLGVGQFVFTYTVAGAGSCPDDEITVTLNVTPLNNAGGDVIAEVCNNDGIIDLQDLLNDGANENGTWFDADDFMVNPAVFNTNVVAGDYNFYYRVAQGACDADTAFVTIRVSGFLSAGLNNTVAVCNTNDEVNLFASLLGSPDMGGVWTDEDGAVVSSIFDASVGAGSYVFTYTQNADNGCEVSATVTVNVTNQLSAGSDAAISTCIGTVFTANAVAASLLGNADLGGALRFGGVVVPSVTLNTVGVFEITYFHAASGGCQLSEAVLTVTVDPATPTAGINGSLDLCSLDPITDLFTGLDGNPTPGGVWTDANGAVVSNLIDPADFTDGQFVFTYTIASINSCPDATATVTVNISTDGPNVGADAQITICASGASFLARSILGSGVPAGGVWTLSDADGNNILDGDNNPIVFTSPFIVNPLNLPLGTSHYRYTLTNNCGTDFSVLSITVNPQPIVPLSFNGLLGVLAGETVEYCEGEEIEVTIASVLSGTAPFTFVYQINDEAEVTVEGLEVGDALFVGTRPAGSYNIVVNSLVDANGCSLLNPQDIYNATLLINPEPAVAIAVNNVVAVTGQEFNFCIGTQVNIVFAAVQAGIAPFTFTYQLNDEPEVTVTDVNVGAVLSSETSPVGVYNLKFTSIVDANGCSVADVEDIYNITININPEPLAVLSFNGVEAVPGSTFEFCDNEEVVVTVSSALSGTAPFSFVYQINDEDEVEVLDLAIGDILFAGTRAAGVYNLVVLELVDSNGCSLSNPEDVYNAEVTINESPAVLFTFNGVEAVTGSEFMYCEDEVVTVVLSSVLMGEAPFDVTYTVNTDAPVTVTVEEGDQLFSGLLSAGTYNVVINSIVDANGCSATDASEIYNAVVVTTPLNNAGADFDGDVCLNDNPITAAELFALLGANAQAGGVWTDADGDAIVFPVVLDQLGSLVFVYTVSGGLCDEASATINLEVNPLPNAGTNGTVDASLGSIVNLFNQLGGTPAMGGAWFTAAGAPADAIFTANALGTFVFTYVVTNDFDCAASATVTVNVSCAVVSVFPYTEGFEANSTTRACWTNQQVVGTANWTFALGAGGGTTPTSNTAFEGVLNARFVSQSAAAFGGFGPITRLVSPVMDVTQLNAPYLEFHYGQEVWFGDINQLKVYYRVSETADWVEIAHFTQATTNWTKAEMVLPEPSATYQIAFEGINRWGRANVLDNVIVGEAPPCIAVTNLAASAITENSATLNWTNANAGASFQVLFGLAGFNVETEGTLLSVTTTTANLTGLESNTAYQAFVRAACGEGAFSPWVSVNFRTLCGIADVPYFENFNASTPGQGPICFAREQVGNPWTVSNSTAIGATSAPNFVGVFFDAVLPKNAWMFTQGLNLEAGVSYTLSFQLRAPGWQGVAEDLAVRIGNNPTATAMGTNAIFTTSGILYPQYTAITATFTVPSNGVYYIGFHTFSAADLDFVAVDDVAVNFTPCPVSAGDDGSATVCAGDAEFNLNTLLSANADLDGVWATTAGVTVPNGIISPLELGNGVFNYTYTVVDDICTDVANFVVTIEACVGIGEINGNGFGVKYFPNPVSSQLTIAVQGINFTNQTELRILDITGKQIAKIKVNDAVTTVDVSYLAEGVYLFELVSGNTVRVNRISVKH